MPTYESINIHPSSHPVSQLATDTYDVICIGSGWAGRVLASRIVAAGLSAVIIENELVGGDCPFWACIPSKVLLRSGEALEDASGVSGSRERVSADKGVDVDAIFARRDKITAGWDDGAVLIPMVESSGASLARGVGRITGEKQVTVTADDGKVRVLYARLAVAVCTGSQPIIPGIAGLAEAKPWTPRHAVSASKAPKSLLILGAGAVGCEMATAYADFGTKVTLVTSGSEILSRFEPQAGKILRDSLISRGVKVHVSTSITQVNRSSAGGMLKAVLTDGSVVLADEILVAAGRRPQTADIGLESFGIPTDGTPVSVDDSLCVDSIAGRWLYAAGDVNGRHPLTHGSKYHGRIIAAAILAGGKGVDKAPWSATSATADTLAQPQVVFTRPTVASVGITKASADKAGIATRVITAPSRTLASNVRRDNATDGWAQWIVEKSSGRLLGATLVGDEVGELLHAYTVAIVGGLTLDRLAHAIPSFPTLSEVHLNLVEAAGL